MRISKDKVMNTLIAGLGDTQDPAQAARLLRQAGFADVPHRRLWEAGVAPAGYVYNEATGRFMRKKSEADVATTSATPTSLAGIAMNAYGVIERGYVTRVDRRRGSWGFPDSSNVDASRALAVVNREVTAEGRARVVRRSLPLGTVVLASANPHGGWDHLPNGNLGAARAAEVLARPFPRHSAPLEQPAGGVAWEPHPAAEAVGSPLVYRREQFLQVVHVGTPVVRAERGKVVDRGVVHRQYDLRQETIFALDESIADDLMGDPEQLEAAYQAHGEGWEDMIAPAAGFVMLDQLVQVGRPAS